MQESWGQGNKEGLKVGDHRRAQAGLPELTGKADNRGPWGQVLGVGWDKLLVPVVVVRVAEMHAVWEEAGGEEGKGRVGTSPRGWAHAGLFVLSLFSLRQVES